MKLVSASISLISFISAAKKAPATWEPECGRVCLKDLGWKCDASFRNKMFETDGLDDGPGSRTIGGEKAKDGMLPWMAGIRVGSEGEICGGTILNRKMILTAASCFTQENSKKLKSDWKKSKVYVGFPTKLVDFEETNKDLKFTEKNAGKGILAIEEIILHKNYNPENKMANVAILLLDEKSGTFPKKSAGIHYHGSIKNDKKSMDKTKAYSATRPACLGTPEFEERAKEEHKLESVDEWSNNGNTTFCVAASYGEDEKGRSGRLKYGEMVVLNKKTCENLLFSSKESPFHKKNGFSVPRANYCAETAPGGRADVCGGDQGAPFQCWTKTEDGPDFTKPVTVMGLSSYTLKCGDDRQPAMFTRIPGVTFWIDQTAKKHGLTVQWVR